MLPIRLRSGRAPLQTLLTRFCSELLVALAERRTALLLVSGGRTPSLYLPRLFNAKIPWERVRISLVDERCVPTASGASNERLVRELLRGTRASVATLDGLVDPQGRPKQRVLHTQRRNALAPDVVLLGCGDDGHTASLFTRDQMLRGGTACYLRTRAPQAPHERVSVTAKWLAEARSCFVITKRERWPLLSSTDDRLPVVRVLRQSPARVPVLLLDD